jgi:uncharacterized protein (TIGR02145 family)
MDVGVRPEGYIDISQEHLQAGRYAYFWSQTQISKPRLSQGKQAASSWYLTKTDEVVHEENQSTLKMSVRCIKVKGSK